jgi:hypothetical protein
VVSTGSRLVLKQDFSGVVPYIPDCLLKGHRLLIAVECSIGDVPYSTKALLDTAAEWSVLPATIAGDLDYDGASGEWTIELSTRFGTFEGRIVELPVTFRAESGEGVSFIAKWFVSDYWHGPAVLGWRGCLDSLNFALNQTECRFYFGPAETIGAA